MCRNIKMLHNFEPPATPEEVEAAALQFVRKISGYQRVPKVNQKAFDAAVTRIARTTEKLLAELEATAPPRNREQEAQKAKERWKQRERRLRSG